MKRLHLLNEPASTLSPANVLKQPALASLPEGYVLYESFEDWDGADMEWTPDGWKVEMKGNVSRDESWSPSKGGAYFPDPSDGQYYYSINYSDGTQDEWLTSPYVEVAEDMELTYWLYLSPVFLYSLDNVDWSTYEYEGDQVVAATLQVWVQPEGGEKVMVLDYAEKYKGYSFLDLMNLEPESLEKNVLSLKDYYGKKISVSFRYVGTDGNTMFIDAIGIGYPSANAHYESPIDTQFWGLNRSSELAGLKAAIAMYPVYYPITWTNSSVEPNLTYTWSYCDPETAEWVTSDNAEELTVTYVPDYKTEASKRNNLFYPPILRAEAAHSTPGEYQEPYVYFQAGGKPEMTLTDGTEFEACMFPFSYNEHGLGMTTVDDEKIGDMSIPVYGYNSNSNQYWLNYSLGDDDEGEIEGDYSHMIGIANLIMPTTDAPIVVNGVTVYGYGLISDDAELKATIYALNSEYNTDYTTFTTIATKTITGSEILREDIETKGYMCMPFDFDSPAVIQASEEHPAFFVMLEGFNSDKVTYFAPLQAKAETNFYYGYILNKIDLSNHIGRPAYYSMKSMRYKEGDEYINESSAFAIGLNAEYPWLACDEKNIDLPADGTPIEIKLGSYYDGSKLTIEAPAGVKATVAGRYDECVLTVALEEAGVEIKGNLVVKGPGVELTLPINGGEGGLNSISAAVSADVKAVYDLAGRRVNASSNLPGVYVVKYTDGTTRKLVIK